MNCPDPCPRLLVSARDAQDAQRALLGGAEIIDFKEPSRGSLGRVANETVRNAVLTLSGNREGVPLLISAALGEVVDGVREPVPTGVRFAKLGLAGLRNAIDWADRWRAARDSAAPGPPGRIAWVGVAYADAVAAQAPPVEKVLEEAQRSGCAGLLIDTCSKSSGRLLDHLQPAELASIARRTHEARMFLALAGRLRIEDLTRLSRVAVDIVAVRSAACEGENRHASVSADRVRRLRDTIRSLPWNGLAAVRDAGSRSISSDAAGRSAG